jgi:hypothetical protein
MRRHDFDPIAFVFGVVFAGLGVVFMTGQLELLNHAQWLWPGLLVLLGLAVLVGARMRAGTSERRPALGSGPSIDPALEDELLHGTVRNIESEHLLDTSSLFTLQRGAKAGEREAPAEVEAPAPVDRDADTELLPPRGGQDAKPEEE